jgi:hypothetical protein
MEGETPYKRSSIDAMSPCTDQANKRFKATPLYPLNGFVKKRVYSGELVSKVVALTPDCMLKASEAILFTANVAADIIHATLLHVDVKAHTFGDDERVMELFTVVSVCMAVKLHIETDTEFSFVQKAFKLQDKFSKREMVLTEAVILDATDWFQRI